MNPWHAPSPSASTRRLARGPELSPPPPSGCTIVNDVHSRLNPTSVASVGAPQSLEEVCALVASARRAGRSVAIAGARHAMGGQQFASGEVLIDATSLKGVLAFDRDRGLIEVEAGIDWPTLMIECGRLQADQAWQWTFAQKQTGADYLTIGGSISANAHGRGLGMKPLIGDVESIDIVDASGELIPCSRAHNADLFETAIGGYGLFGFIYSVTLRLMRRRKVRRMVEITGVDRAVPCIMGRHAAGAMYGDFQFAIDPCSSDFLDRGVLSWYEPVDDNVPLREDGHQLPRENWLDLLHLAHTDKAAAFRRYACHYESTHGQVYWSDAQQMSTYVPDYAEFLASRLRPANPESLIITELFVPRIDLPRFMDAARRVLRRRSAEVIYGTVRVVERDDESFLAFARQACASVIFNVRTAHTPQGLARSACVLRELIDQAIALGGSFYLTYHRFATRQQVQACYPQFREFLRLKSAYDPHTVFTSDWHRHYARLFNAT